jgi:hypothetical protein
MKRKMVGSLRSKENEFGFEQCSESACAGRTLSFNARDGYRESVGQISFVFSGESSRA